MRLTNSCGVLVVAIALGFNTTFCTRATTTNFFEGFESGLTNWIVGDNDPFDQPAYWGVVDVSFGGEEVHSGEYKAYCAATGYTGTADNPTYVNNMRAYLSRTINLTGYTNATLSFWYRIPEIEAAADYARVIINGVQIWSMNQLQTNWTLATLSLESFVGAVQSLTFEFESDFSLTREGWYLDDILLTDAASPGVPPATDAFTAAQLIMGSIGTVNASNRGAASEVNEMDPGNSIWFRWAPYTNGLVTFRTGGSSFDTMLCVA